MFYLKAKVFFVAFKAYLNLWEQKTFAKYCTKNFKHRKGSIMDATLLMEYGLVLLVLIVLEGVLSADNALVLAIMVKHLPEKHRHKALFYGLVGAFIFRLAALFLISFLANVWQMQALGAAYLLFIAYKNLRSFGKDDHDANEADQNRSEECSKKEFWMTVLKVELADIAFAIDSILAAVALAMALPPTTFGQIGGLDAGQFVVIFLGGFVGLIIMRFCANIFVDLLQNRPSLEKAAFIIVGWVGVKLVVATLAHPAVGIIDEHFPHSLLWKVIFFGVLIGIAVWGWFSSKPEDKAVIETKPELA